MCGACAAATVAGGLVAAGILLTLSGGRPSDFIHLFILFDFLKAVAPAAGAMAADDEHVVQTRTYDVMITYDVHYSTPRVWLFGYDAGHRPLASDAWRQDFSAEHVDRTVTHEAHPHEAFSCPSIHPCKHAQAMLKMSSLVAGASGAQIDVKLCVRFRHPAIAGWLFADQPLHPFPTVTCLFFSSLSSP